MTDEPTTDVIDEDPQAQPESQADAAEFAPEVDVADETDADETADAVDDESEGDESEGDAASDEGPRRSKREEALTNEAEIAADYLEELLDIADLDGDIDTFNEGGRAHISILSDSDILVGKNGEVLDALQELARLAVMTGTGHRSRLMLDIAGHREKRRKVLQDLAADAVEAVRSTGEPVRLSPMNPFERKIVHDAIAAAGLVSESEGEEPRRRVVVMPKG